MLFSPRILRLVIPPVALAVLFSPSSLSADPVRVVDYGGDMGSGYYRDTTSARQTAIEVDVDGDGDASNDSLSFWAFSFSEPMSPVGNLYDVEAASAIFYGGITAFFAEPGRGLIEGLLNENHERRDDWNMMTGEPDKPPVRCYGFWFWKKEDFLNGGDQYAVSFGEGSKIVPHVSRYFSGLDDGRWVVQDGGQFYISEKTFGDYLAEIGKSAFTHTSYVLDPATTNWAPYNPSEPYDIVFDIDGAVFAPHTFADVRAVGFYVYAHTLREEDIGFKWHSFEVYAEVARPAGPSWHADLVTVPAGSLEGHAMPSFSIGRTEVPYALWKQVYKWAVSNQYAFDLDPGYSFNKDGDMGSMDLGGSHSADEPATDMTWEDAVLWCNALSELEGLTPVYYADAGFEQVLRSVQQRDFPANYNHEFPVFMNGSASGFRLPTPLEWAYASGAGGALGLAPTEAWTAANAGGTTRVVGQLAANAFGLHDTGGNVWEFVWDLPADASGYDPAVHNTRTVLGGGFKYPEDRTSTPLLPHGDEPWKGSPAVGFRIMRSHGQVVAAGISPSGIPAWSFGQGEVIAPATPPVLDAALVASEMSARIAGTETFGQVGDPDYEDDNLGFERDDEAFVRITPFYMGRTEITYAQWNAVYQWALRNGYTFDRDGDLGSMDWQTGLHTHSPDEPVTDVGWNDVVVWCNALSEYEGLDPVYHADEDRMQVLRSANRWRNRMDMAPAYNTANSEQLMAVYPRWENNGYRLPTAAEWEAAHRDGQQAVSLKYPWGSSAADAVHHGWVKANANDKTRTVGLKPANGYGLHDLTGNAAEWTWDWPGNDYYKSHNPKGRVEPNTLFGKEVRGSNFGSNPFEIDAHDEERESCPRAYTGFRVVRCDTGEHPEDQTFIPEKVIDLDPADFALNQDAMFRYNNHRTGHTTASGLPVGQPQIAWQFATGAAVSASPVAVNGIVYLGSEDGKFYAIDETTGVKVWEFDAGAPVKSSAAVVDGFVYFGAGLHLFKVNAATGSEVWRFTRGTGTEVTVAPAVAHGIVYTAFGRFSTSAYSGIDVATGQEVWRFRLGMANSGPMGPSIDGLTLYAPYADNKVMSADLETEYPNWSPTGHRSKACMAILDSETVLYMQLHNLKALDRADGSTRWSYDVGGSFDDKPESSPAFGPVDLGGGSSEIYAFVGSLYGDFHAINTSNGSGVWSFYTGGSPESGAPIKSSPTLSNNRVYFGSDNGTLYCLDAATGDTVWNLALDTPLSSSPWVGNNRVIIGGRDGVVYALGVSSGPPDITAIALPDATAGSEYSASIATTGGVWPLSWTVSAGSLPDGITLDSAGTLSGSASFSGTYNFSVTVTDGNGDSDTQAFLFTVAQTPLGAPTGFSATANGSRIELAWHDNASAETGFLIERRDITNGVTPGNEVVLDNNREQETGSGNVVKTNWWNQTFGSDYHGANWSGRPAVAGGNASATYTPDLSAASGNYEVFLKFPAAASGNLAGNQPVTVNHDSGSSVVIVDLNQNGGSWVSLGTFTLGNGTASVQFTNDFTPSGGSWAVADAVRFSLPPQSAPWSLIASGLAPDTQAFTDTDVTAGRIYEYRVRAADGLTEGDWSVARSVTATSGRPRPPVAAGGWNLHPNTYWSHGNYFANKMFHASDWENNWTQYDFPLNSRGYPTDIPTGTTPAAKITLYESGIYTLRWTGVGEVILSPAVGGAVVFVSENLGGTVKERTYLKTTADAEEALCRVMITATDSLDPVEDIEVWAPGHAPAIGQAPASHFHDSFLARISENASILRFMDWGATNNSDQLIWADRRAPDYATQRQPIAWEHIVALCNELNMDLWICVPHQADDDYVQKLAHLIRTGEDGPEISGPALNPGLKVYLEYSNEVWNTLFNQQAYAVGRDAADPETANADQWTGRRHAEIWQIFMTEFGSEWPQRIVRVLGTQVGGNRIADNLAGVALVDGVEADVVAVAPYFGYNFARHAVAAIPYQNPSEDDYEAAITELRRTILEDERLLWTQTVTLAAGFGLPVIAYEGGQHIVARYEDINNDGTPDIDDDDLTAFLNAVNRRAEMQTLQSLALDVWESVGGGLFLAFNDVSPYAKYGSWGYREFWHDDASDAPKASAFETWLARQQQSHLISYELQPGGLGYTYYMELDALERTAPLTFSITSGALPEGVGLSSAGVLSGLPTDYGTFEVGITLTDGILTTDTKTFELVVEPEIDGQQPDQLIPHTFKNWALAETGGTLAFTADGDLDGIQNLVEYALNLNPEDPDSSAGTMILSDTGPRFEFAFNPALRDLRYRVRQSTDLVDWETLRFDSATDTAGREHTWHTISIEAPSDAPEVFFRIEIEPLLPQPQ